MRVVCILDEIARELGHEPADVARETGLDVRHIRKLIHHDPTWRLERSHIDRLTLYAFDRGYRHGIFEVRPHPVWSTFAHGPITIYRASKDWDATVEGTLRRFLQSFVHHHGAEYSEPSTRLTSEEDIHSGSAEISVRESMKSENCIFLGSPKTNPATEVALAELWNAKPFNKHHTNRKKIPVHFRGMSAPAGRESAVLENGIRTDFHGFQLRVADQGSVGLLPVTWSQEAHYRRWSGTGKDGAVVVVARHPSESEGRVTSIIISGYTGRATSFAAKELVHGDPPFSDEVLKTDVPNIAALSFKFRKSAGGPTANLSLLREDIEGSGAWGPPWDGLLKFQD